jgi:hypothetical protein
MKPGLDWKNINGSINWWNNSGDKGMARITYDLEIPDDELWQMDKFAKQQTDGNIGWGDAIDYTLQSAAKKISPGAKFVFVDFHCK